MSDKPEPREVDGWQVWVDDGGDVCAKSPWSVDCFSAWVGYAQDGPVGLTIYDEQSAPLTVVRAMLEMWEEMQ